MPAVRLNITDDQEFQLCQYCASRLEPIDVNHVTADNLYNQTLLSYHHLNCEKCGSYIELNCKLSSGQSTVFLCANASPHQHCLCADCGALYGYFVDNNSNNDNLKSYRKNQQKLSRNKSASKFKWCPKTATTTSSTQIISTHNATATM